MTPAQLEKKIRILLLDDRDSLDPKGGLPPQYAKWFEIRWLSTPSEARAYRDASWLCLARKPETLGKLGWVPEIFGIDYALTQENRTVFDWVNQDNAKYRMLSPLPGLQDALSEVGLNHDALALDSPPVTPPAGSEFWGCYIGGLILATFADYPVAAVSITRYGPDVFLYKAKDIAFFEWLMERQTNEQLKGTGKEGLTWSEIICDGARKLQERLKQLAQVGIITLHLDELLQLAHNGEHPHLAFTSRYGTRHLAVQGLFINEGNERERKKIAQEWAGEVVKDALSYLESGEAPSEYTSSVDEIEEGLRRAKQLWGKWESERVPVHLEFSRVTGQAYHALKIEGRELTPEEREALSLWCQNYAVVLDDIITTLRNQKYTLQTEGDVREYDCSGSVKRWAILFTIVRMACMAWHVSQALRRDFEITTDDVFLAIYPLAMNVPYYLHENRPTGEHTIHLKRLNKDGSLAHNGWGDIGISIPDVLIGRDCGGQSHGLFPFERRVLRMFAAGCGCGDRQQWKEGTVLGNLLLGKSPASAEEE